MFSCGRYESLDSFGRCSSGSDDVRPQVVIAVGIRRRLLPMELASVRAECTDIGPLAVRRLKFSNRHPYPLPRTAIEALESLAECCDGWPMVLDASHMDR